MLEDHKTYLTTDAVLSAAYEYDGKAVQFIVNYNLTPVEISFDKKYDVYFDSSLQNVEKGRESVTIEPLSVIMLSL